MQGVARSGNRLRWRLASSVRVCTDMSEQSRRDSGPHAPRPRLVDVIDLKCSSVVQQHSEGEKRLDRHGVEPRDISHRLPNSPEAVPNRLANLSVAAGCEALELQQQRG